MGSADAGKAAVRLAAVALALASGWAGAARADESAVWTPKEVSFVYQGFTTTYSCDGLRDKMRQVLLELGAREDLSLQTACAALTGPDLFPHVRIKMHVLQPAGADGGPGAVAAHWRSVTLPLDRDPLSAANDCELVEQVKQQVLPAFTVRNVQFHSACVPHQPQIGGTELHAEVLVADRKPAASAAR
jgi:hypothetical protein